MIQIKRQLSIDNHSCDKTKKLRKFGNITCIEDLSNEILYEIFDYLDGCHVYEAFSNLNKRFQCILSSSCFRPKIILTSHQELAIQHCCKNIILPNQYNITSLNLLDTLAIDSIFQSIIFDTSFHRLESIVLFGLKLIDLLPCILKLTSLPRLYFLTVTINEKPLIDFSNVYRLIFSLPVLKYNKLCVEGLVPPISVRNINNQPSTIEHLNIDHSCNLNDLTNMFSYTPHLCRLVCKILNQSYQRIDKMTIVLPHLTHISIESCCLPFDVFETFIKKISSKIQTLRISTSDDESYLDADRWERLISQLIPHLHNFYFKYRESITDDFQVNKNHALVDHFTSPFWRERRWLLALEINVNFAFNTHTTYSIQPYKKKWYKLNEFSKNNKHSNQNTGLNPSQGTELIIFEPSFTGYNESLIDNMACFFDIVLITKLDVVFEATFVGMLLDLLRHLPYLDSLRIWSLSLKKPRPLHLEEENRIQLISNTNKIRRVNIQQIDNSAQVQFLINLCPSMEYFEIGSSNDINWKSIAVYILRINRKRIPHLRVLCLCTQTTNDEMIDGLQKIINTMKSRFKYTIQRIGNKIYIQKE